MLLCSSRSVCSSHLFYSHWKQWSRIILSRSVPLAFSVSSRCWSTWLCMMGVTSPAKMSSRAVSPYGTVKIKQRRRLVQWGKNHRSQQTRMISAFQIDGLLVGLGESCCMCSLSCGQSLGVRCPHDVLMGEQLASRSWIECFWQPLDTWSVRGECTLAALCLLGKLSFSVQLSLPVVLEASLRASDRQHPHPRTMALTFFASFAD